MRRNYFILLCSCVLFAIAGRTQTAQLDKISLANYVAKAERETSAMKDSLNLTTFQMPQVDSINKQYLKSIALLEGQPIPLAARALKMAEYKAKRDDDLAAVLTAQQLQKYKDLLKAQEDRMKARLQTQ